MKLLGELLNAPLTTVTFCVGLFALGQWIHHKTKLAIANPILISQAIIVLMIFYTPMTAEAFLANTALFSALLIPATASLALGVYKNLKILGKYAIPILISTLAGAGVSIAFTLVAARWLGLDRQLAVSLAPKSVTSPIAMELAVMNNGLAGIAALAVIITGLTGAVMGPWLLKVFHVKDPIVQGVTLGTSSHITGTICAMELGELQGAMSGLSLCITGLMTVLLFAIFI